MPKSKSLPSLFAPSLFFKEPRERFALVALLLTKNERFARKTKERISNPAYNTTDLMDATDVSPPL